MDAMTTVRIDRSKGNPALRTPPTSRWSGAVWRDDAIDAACRGTPPFAAEGGGDSASSGEASGRSTRRPP